MTASPGELRARVEKVIGLLDKREPQYVRMCAEAAIRDALDRIAELEGALEPFAGEFAKVFVDDEGWTGPMNKERIVDWFGPSDFRRARSLLP